MRIERYRWAGGDEAMLRFGPAEGGPTVILAMPLFEEANRTRAFAVRLLRLLAEQGIGGALPDLPGQGESLVAVEAASLDGWRDAFAAAARTLAAPAAGPVHVAAIRGGALVDTLAVAASRWHLAPTGGDALVRELMRTRAVAGGAAAPAIDLGDPADDGPAIELAGNRVSRAMLRALHVAERALDEPLRTVRLASDPAVAERKLDGAPLWRRAEPGDDPALAALLADDLAGWIATCGG